MKRLLYLAILSMTALVLFAPAVSAQDDMTVSIKDFSFSPAQITVPQGTTVTWTNEGPSPHTTTADDGTWDSGTMEQGEDFSFTFDDPGTYTYHCSIHPQMTATIKVSGSAKNSAGASMSTSASAYASPSASAAPAAQYQYGSALPSTGGVSSATTLLAIIPAILLLVGGGLLSVILMRRS